MSSTINMNNTGGNSNGGIGFLGLLALLFIALKLIGVIKWAWIWVLSPLWGGLLFGIIIGVIIAILSTK